MIRFRFSRFQRFFSKSLIRRCLFTTAAAAAVILLALQFILSHWVYGQIKPSLLQNDATLMSAAGTQVSYLLHQNSQFLRTIYENEALLDRLADAAELPDADQKVACLKQLEAELPREARGADEPGALLSSRSIILLLDQTDWICPEDLLPYRDGILRSEWFSALPGHLSSLAGRYEGKVIKSYSPVFAENRELGYPSFLALAKAVEWKGHEILIFMLEPFSEFEAIFDCFEAARIPDYALVGHYPIYTQSSSEEFSSLLLQDSGSLVTDRQYEVLQTSSEDSVLLASGSLIWLKISSL